MDITEFRGMQIDSILVKIMKSRKEYKMNQLYEEASNMINLFKLDIKSYKKRVEVLITKCYLKRNENQNDLIHYIS